jgi:hypothetical protein
LRAVSASMPYWLVNDITVWELPLSPHTQPPALPLPPPGQRRGLARTVCCLGLMTGAAAAYELGLAASRMVKRNLGGEGMGWGD